MAEPARSPHSPGEPLPRCCPHHPDWPTLSHHLTVEFPELDAGDIVREVHRAKEAVEHVNLEPSEALITGELIARHQLAMLSGRVTEVARLDPERHARTLATPPRPA